MLIDHGAELHEGFDPVGNSPLLWSCFHGQRQSMQTVTRRGARVSNLDKLRNNCFHKTVLCNQEFSDVIQGILEDLIGQGADINHPNDFGNSPLFMAAQEQKSMPLIKQLLKLGAQVNQTNLSGATPLMEACCKPNPQVVEIILQHKPDLTPVNNHGLSALALACRFGHLENVKALIKSGADVTVCDRNGHTPFFTAANNAEIGLEILATPQYFPRYPATTKAFAEPAGDVEKLEQRWLKWLESKVFDKDQVAAIMHWAITNGALKLARRCVPYDPQVSKWSRNGATWLHVVAQYGQTKLLEPETDASEATASQPVVHGLDVMAPADSNVTALHVAALSGRVDIARILLQMLPDHPRKVEMITAENNQGESPITISISQRHKELEVFFWEMISQLGEEYGNFMESNRTEAVRILELLAQYEKPGREVVLRQLLRQWFRGKEPIGENPTTLEWAVRSSQAVVVWWLLSNGGYSSGNAIARALKLVPNSNYAYTDTRRHIRDMLLQPPPILEQVANPDTDSVTTEPRLIDDGNPSLTFQANIVDTYSNGGEVNITYKEASIFDVVYDRGPRSLMRAAKADLSLHNLDVLRATLRNCDKDERNHDTHSSSREKARPPQPEGPNLQPGEAADGEPNLKLRWIHLPVNEDLVCRLSHDSNRTTLNHSILMKHFNRNWTELAAGGKRSYMKPQCVQTHLSTTQNPFSSESVTLTALYMPFLVVGTYDNATGYKDQMDESDRSGGLDESISGRNMRQVAHKPITLDQYYYPAITDTVPRDNDQVLSKYLKQEEKIKKTVFRVDNLWIWIVDETADRNFSKKITDNIRYGGMRSRFERATTVESMMELILGVATESFTEKYIPIPGMDLKKGAVEIFRESIRDETNRETELFQAFLAGLRHEAKTSSSFQNTDPLLAIPGRQVAAKEVASNRYHVISSEAELLSRTRDICDELHILMSLAEDQDVVWKQALSSFQHYHSCRPTDVKKDLKEILSAAEQTADYIITLLELRQAEHSRLQAQEAARQSNSILIFTIITIIFLPLSFLASLFALDVSNFPHDGGDLRYEGWWLFPILFGVSVIVSAPTIFLAWNVNGVVKWFRQRKDDGPQHDTNQEVTRQIPSKPFRSRLGLRRRTPAEKSYP
ncbi:hypothetical protein GGR52DRAFT_578759 [Hypoxylon sp. FL1284]|nr:hypothetical protein GGR52DRAFT_578759 [Hypoxylon sp. FL1284]